MSHLLAAGFAIATVIALVPGLAAADTVYETVDAVETISFPSNHGVKVTGIKAGEGSPTTNQYTLGSAETEHRCDRMALLAMSKPGKFQLVLVFVSNSFQCKLVVRTP